MKILFFIIFALLSYNSFTQAQAPNSFSYQAVVRNTNGTTTNNQAVAFRISIVQTTITGTTVYSERQTTTTNDFGLVNLEIGNGSTLSGNMASIDWGSDDYFVKVEFDATGGTNYTTMGTTQLLSVPFAMYAQSSGDKVWEKSNGHAIFNNGNVGIGTSNPITKFDLTQTAAIGAERLATFRISDAANQYLAINNITNANGVFVPTLSGVNTQTPDRSLGLMGSIDASYDIGTTAIVQFNARRVTGPAITRPLFEWVNYTTRLMTLSANGNLGIGTTTPARQLHITEAMRLAPTASAPSNPSAGDMYFSSTVNKLMVYDGAIWQSCW